MASPAGLLSPLALDEARRVGEAAASELDAVLADLEAWVNLDTPSYDVAALDAFAGILAENLEGYGLRSELVEAALRRGAAAYIVKTVNPDDLPATLRQALEGNIHTALGLEEVRLHDRACRRAA